MQDSFTLFFDGASKSNPGHAGAGAVIYKNNVEFAHTSSYLGNHISNNFAEYSALIIGLQLAMSLDIKDIQVFGDSMLVIKQINKLFKVRSNNIKPLFDTVTELLPNFNHISFNHVYRQFNKRADQLSNFAITYKNL